nr:hypothetical protein [uncultured Mediterranean phage uvMED]
MIYTVFRDNLDDGLEVLGEYDQETLDIYCEMHSQFLKYDRYDLIIVAGRIVE